MAAMYPLVWIVSFEKKGKHGVNLGHLWSDSAPDSSSGFNYI